MATTQLAAPQLVLNSRMLYTSWIPEDPQACERLLPRALKPAGNRAVYMNQYVVDSPEQTTGFGAYSLTYLGLDTDLFAPDGVTPARFFTHYFNSSQVMREYAAQRGVPAGSGSTTLEVEDGIAPRPPRWRAGRSSAPAPGWVTWQTSCWAASCATSPG